MYVVLLMVEQNSYRYNPLGYPLGYFRVQVEFAFRWSELSRDSFSDSLLSKTALYRRLTGIPYEADEIAELWFEVIKYTDESRDLQTLSQLLFDLYKQQPHSSYENSKELFQESGGYGTFSYTYLLGVEREDGLDSIKIHFFDLHRSNKTGLDSSMLLERKNDLQRMFTDIKKVHPNARQVIGASWLYNKKIYKDIFPEEFINTLIRLVPDGLAGIPNSIPSSFFLGNSLWGQFINHFGWMNTSRQRLFEKNMRSATSIDELVFCFPMQPLIAKSDINVFYKNVDNEQLWIPNS